MHDMHDMPAGILNYNDQGIVTFIMSLWTVHFLPSLDYMVEKLNTQLGQTKSRAHASTAKHYISSTQC